jgi:hypothetical protein
MYFCPISAQKRTGHSHRRLAPRQHFQEPGPLAIQFLRGHFKPKGASRPLPDPSRPTCLIEPCEGGPPTICYRSGHWSRPELSRGRSMSTRVGVRRSGAAELSATVLVRPLARGPLFPSCPAANSIGLHVLGDKDLNLDRKRQCDSGIIEKPTNIAALRPFLLGHSAVAITI